MDFGTGSSLGARSSVPKMPTRFNLQDRKGLTRFKDPEKQNSNIPAHVTQSLSVWDVMGPRSYGL
eukprot:scaffold229345_cov21-Tisochrysis_lutea.AAC.1